MVSFPGVSMREGDGEVAAVRGVKVVSVALLAW